MKRALLIGAGFSFDLGMPLSKELTKVFLSLFYKNSVEKFIDTISKKNPYGNDRPINKNAIISGMRLVLDYKKSNGVNYEAILSDIESIKGIKNPTQSDKDSYNFLYSIFYSIIHEILTKFQVVSYDTLYKENFKWYSKFENLLNDNNETWIFNLNHDLYIECIALDKKIPITYGDSSQIKFPISNIEMSNQINFTYAIPEDLNAKNKEFFNNTTGINLVKLHGGLSEFTYSDKRNICNLSLKKNNSKELLEEFINMNQMGYFYNGKKAPSGGRDRTITNIDGELDIITNSMLTGGHKYSKTLKIKAGEEKLKLFNDILSTVDELVVIGYSYGDRHINNCILNCLVKNENFTIRTIDPSGMRVPSFMEQFDYDMRLKGAGCRTAEWIEYHKTEKWNAEQSEALRENEKIRNIIIDTIKKNMN